MVKANCGWTTFDSLDLSPERLGEEELIVLKCDDMSQRQGVPVANCPIKLRVYHPFCYWSKKGKCAFTLGGYDKKGQPKREQEAEKATDFTLVREQLAKDYTIIT